MFKIFLICILLTMIATSNIVNKNLTSLDKNIFSESNWIPIIIDSNSIYVTWQSSFGNEQTISAIGLWETSIEYLITFKDGAGIRLRKSNIICIEYKHSNKR